MHRETWGLFFTDRWVAAPWATPPAGATWATKYQGKSLRGAQDVAEIWNRRHQLGKRQQQAVKARQRAAPRVRFRSDLPSKFHGYLHQTADGGRVPTELSDARSYQDPEGVLQGLIMPGIGPRSEEPDVDRTSAGAGGSVVIGPGAPVPGSRGLSAAFLEAQANFPPLTFDSVANLGGGRQYRYASLTALLACVRPVLNAAGITVRQPASVDDQGCVTVETILQCGDEVWREPMRLPAKSPNPHDIASTITYAKRYSLASICGIAAEEDDDGHRAQSTAEKEQGRSTPAAKRQRTATAAAPAGGKGHSSPDPSAGVRAGPPEETKGDKVREGLTGELVKAEPRTSTKGKPYVLVEVKDRQETVTMYCWDTKLGEAILTDVQIGTTVHVTYERGTYPKLEDLTWTDEKGNLKVPGIGAVPF